jgi:hypothetical protein
MRGSRRRFYGLPPLRGVEENLVSVHIIQTIVSCGLFWARNVTTCP